MRPTKYGEVRRRTRFASGQDKEIYVSQAGRSQASTVRSSTGSDGLASDGAGRAESGCVSERRAPVIGQQSAQSPGSFSYPLESSAMSRPTDQLSRTSISRPSPQQHAVPSISTDATFALPSELEAGVRIPTVVIGEMFSNVGKNARLRTEFIRKYEMIRYLLGIPWLESKTRRWIIVVLGLQLASWTLCVTSTGAAALAERIPRYIPALLAPLITLHHFVGYLSFARRTPVLTAIFCIFVVVTAAWQGTEIVTGSRALMLRPTSNHESLSLLIIAMCACTLGVATDLTLFFAATTLYIRMKHEESETRVLIPIEALEETPNDLPFLRWYFSLAVE